MYIGSYLNNIYLFIKVLNPPRRGSNSACRRNTTYVWPRVSHSLWAFVLFPRQRLFFCLCFAPHSRTSFSSCTFFNFPYFPLCSTLPSQNPVEHARPRSFLQFTSSLHSTLSCHVLSFSPAFSYPVLPFFFVLPMFVLQAPPKILLSLPARGLFSSVLPTLSLYPSLPYFPVLWI